MGTGIAPIMGTVFASALAITASAQMSDVKTFHATLSGAHEVPPVTTAGTGRAEIKLDTATKTLSWTVSYKDLSGPALAAHIHGPAAAVANGPVLIPFKDPGSSPITGSKNVTDTEIADLMAGKTYVNIHTAEHKPGEIRGQIMPGM
jgi:CHRD domain